MLIISYDISNDKLRTKFSKYLSKYGHRLQYSLFEIENSNRWLEIIKLEIEHKFSNKFEETDSIMIFDMSASCSIIKYGYAKHQNEDFIIL